MLNYDQPLYRPPSEARSLICPTSRLRVRIDESQSTGISIGRRSPGRGR